MGEMEEKNQQNSQIVSLTEASQMTGYSQGYLNFLIRSGKLKGAKIGRNWTTTKEWLNQYFNLASESNQDSGVNNQTDTFSKAKPKRLMISFSITALVFLLVIAGFNLGITQDHFYPASISGFFNRAFEKIQDKLGDKYIEMINFFIPAYSLELDSQPLIIRTKESVLKIDDNKEVKEIVIIKNADDSSQEKITQITKITETIQSTDLSKINQDIESLSSRLTTLASQISSKIDYTVPSYAPVYIPSSGLQVAGNSILTTLNVSGGASIGDSLSVHKNAQFGNPKDDTDTLTVYSNSTFYNSATFSG